MDKLIVRELSEHPELLLGLVGFAALGTLWALLQLIDGIWAFWTMFLRPGKNLRKYGSWAIVTGATDGIGKSLAKELARRKLNIILVSRTLEKLQDFGNELEQKYGVKTNSVAVDLSRLESESSKQGFAKLESLVTELEVGILVNNAGVSYPYAKYLDEVDDELVSALIAVNIVAATRITRLVLPHMLRRKRGAIINVGSGAATVIPSDPLYSVYAATKAYIDQFSKSLSVEYRHRGIDVQCQAPLYVATKLAKIRKPSLTCPSADRYAKASVAWIGYDARCTPYWVHAIMWAFVSRLPAWLMDSVRLSQNLNVRKRGMAKDSRLKKGS